MASDLISRDALLEDLRESVNWLHKIYGGLEYEDEKRICSAEIASFTEVILRVKDAPAVDAVEVVRCKDCKYSHPCHETDKRVRCLKRGMSRDNEWFCADGEQKEGARASD